MSGCLPSVCAILIAGASVSIGDTSAFVTVEPVDHGIAVTYQNRLAKMLNTETFVIDMDGLAISGAILSRGGKAPDDLHVYPPVGWWCDPCVVTVEEDQRGTVTLYREYGA